MAERKGKAHRHDVVGAARGAFRWFVMLAMYDVMSVAALVLVAALTLIQGVVFVALPVAILAAVFAYQGALKIEAGRRIRAGVEAKDGHMFASGFASLRKLLIWIFWGNVCLLVQQVSCSGEGL